MTVFGLELDDSRTAQLFAEVTRQNDVFKEYFGGRIKVVMKGAYDWHLISVHTPLPIPFGVLGFIGFTGMAIVWGVTPWLVLPVVVMLPELLHTKWFWFLMSWRSLRRMKYKGHIRLLKDEEVMRLVMES